MIDFFSEEFTSHRWEQFAESFFSHRGNNIVKGASFGPDMGADLIIEEEIEENEAVKTIRILVSCKFSPTPIGITNESDISDRLLMHDCYGFYGFYASTYTGSLVKKLDEIKKNMPQRMKVFQLFDDHSIETFLKENLENGLFRNNFDKAFRVFISNTAKRIEENTNFKKLVIDDFRPLVENQFREFYAGAQPTWDVIKRYTFKRDIFDTVVSTLRAENIALLTGAGGEGKTTLMMQIACHYFDQNFEVFYAFEGLLNVDILRIQFNKAKQYLVVIDQANDIANLEEFIQSIRLKRNVKILLAARKNEWLQYLSRSPNFKTISLVLANKEFILSKLSQSEIGLLRTLLTKHNSLHESAEKDFVKNIADGSERSFLLATMILATKGKSFEFYIADVINNIKKWENGFESLRAIAFVSLLELLGIRANIYNACSERNLLALLNLNQKTYHQIRTNLAEEAFFQTDVNKSIKTRHPRIAEIYLHILFLQTPALFDLADCCEEVLHEQATKGDRKMQGLIQAIPLFLRELKLTDLSNFLLQKAISYGYFFRHWTVFIEDQRQSGNIGHYLNFSARWLCLKAFERNPKIFELYPKWIEVELAFGIPGNIDIEHSIRWVFYQAYLQKHDKDKFYSKWAQFEIDQGYIGNLDFQPEFSARWLLHKGFEKKIFHHNLVTTWADLETRLDNIGDISYTTEYSARWIFKTALSMRPYLHIYSQWAGLELSQNNIGDINNSQEYSARWIFKRGLEHTRDSSIYAQWAKLEVQMNNLGDVQSPMQYSARWILRQIFDKDPQASLIVFWAKLELRENNIGELTDECDYSARWILRSAIDSNQIKELPLIYLFWAKMESSLGNFGSSDTKFSATWLLDKLLENDTDNLTVLTLLCAVQYFRNIPDDDIRSSKRLFDRLLGFKSIVFYKTERFQNFDDWASYLDTHGYANVFKPTDIKLLKNLLT